MNKKIAGLALLAASSVVSHSAHADNYFGFDVALANIEITAGSDSVDFDTKLLQGKVGSYINPYFAIEARLAIGVQDDSIEPVTFKTPYSLGAFARGILPVNEKFEVYGMAGFTQSEFEIEISGDGSASDTDNDLSIGLGTNIKFDPDTALNIEYVNVYNDKEDGAEIDVSSINIGFTRLF